MITPTEIEALLLRHHGAMLLLGQEDPFELLAMVVAPSEDVLRASLTAAEEKGASALAVELADRRARAEKKKERGREAGGTRTPVRGTRPRQRDRVSFDEIMSAA